MRAAEHSVPRNEALCANRPARAQIMTGARPTPRMRQAQMQGAHAFHAMPQSTNIVVRTKIVSRRGERDEGARPAAVLIGDVSLWRRTLDPDAKGRCARVPGVIA